MNAPTIRIVYAWQTDYSHGAIFETLEDAESIPDMRDSGASLLKIYVSEDGRVVHTEEVPA